LGRSPRGMNEVIVLTLEMSISSFPIKVMKHALKSAPHALHVRAGHGSSDYIPRLVSGIPGTRHDRVPSAGTRAVLRPTATRT
jgi:hypothetical protein